VLQIARIERRQTRIRLIRQKIDGTSPGVTENEYVPENPEPHHHIGVSENRPQAFSSFLQAHSDDPAIKVS